MRDQHKVIKLLLHGLCDPERRQFLEQPLQLADCRSLLHMAVKLNRPLSMAYLTKRNFDSSFLDLIQSESIGKGVALIHCAAQAGNLSYVTQLVKSHGAEHQLTCRDVYGRSPAHYATCCDQLSVLQYMVAEWPECLSLQDNDGLTPRDVMQKGSAVSNWLATLPSAGTSSFVPTPGLHVSITYATITSHLHRSI